MTRSEPRFSPLNFVNAIGVTKGRGFGGVVKRHHFRGGDSTHGARKAQAFGGDRPASFQEL